MRWYLNEFLTVLAYSTSYINFGIMYSKWSIIESLSFGFFFGIVFLKEINNMH